MCVPVRCAARRWSAALPRHHQTNCNEKKEEAKGTKKNNKTARKITILVVIVAPPEFNIQSGHYYSFSLSFGARNDTATAIPAPLSFSLSLSRCTKGKKNRKKFGFRMIERDFLQHTIFVECIH